MMPGISLPDGRAHGRSRQFRVISPPRASPSPPASIGAAHLKAYVVTSGHATAAGAEDGAHDSTSALLTTAAAAGKRCAGVDFGFTGSLMLLGGQSIVGQAGNIDRSFRAESLPA